MKKKNLLRNVMLISASLWIWLAKATTVTVVYNYDSGIDNARYTATLEDGMVLVWDATNEVWVNKQGGGVIDELGDIGDVNLTSLTDGQIIVRNALAQKWINADIATNLSELTDVSLGALTNLDSLRYNLTRQRWENYSADEVVTENSTNVITSGATFTAIKTVADKLGDLATLKTTDKTSVVNALNEVYDALVNRRGLIGKRYEEVGLMFFSLSGYSKWMKENTDPDKTKLITIDDMYTDRDTGRRCNGVLF
jgi:hypothetical protein